LEVPLARRKSTNLTEAELRMMKALWKKQRATVAEVAEALRGDPPLAYNTVLTMMRILENKGYVRHTKQGRAFVYEAVVRRDQASAKAIRHLVSRFFGGSTGQLVMKLLEENKLDAKELERIKTRISQSE
jgi:predicted transcriptional regulator